MAIDMNTALAKYGWVGQLANSIPELRQVFSDAAHNEWTPDEFQRQLEGSPWWQGHADAVRKLAVTQATDPATYQQNLANAADKVRLAALQQGRDVDSGSLALQLLSNNWDDQQLNSIIGSTGAVRHGDSGALEGDAAQIMSHMKQVAANYGVSVGQSWFDASLGNIQSGRDSLDGISMALQNRAKMTYPQFASQIDAGQTVRQIADPWIQTMAKTLEVSDSAINLDDSYIKKALTQRNADGSGTAQPLWQFERQLKDDPRYDKTTQARTDAYSVLAKVGKDFGFAS